MIPVVYDTRERGARSEVLIYIGRLFRILVTDIVNEAGALEKQIIMFETKVQDLLKPHIELTIWRSNRFYNPVVYYL